MADKKQSDTDENPTINSNTSMSDGNVVNITTTGTVNEQQEAALQRSEEEQSAQMEVEPSTDGDVGLSTNREQEQVKNVMVTFKNVPSTLNAATGSNEKNLSLLLAKSIADILKRTEIIKSDRERSKKKQTRWDNDSNKAMTDQMAKKPKTQDTDAWETETVKFVPISRRPAVAVPPVDQNLRANQRQRTRLVLEQELRHLRWYNDIRRCYHEQKQELVYLKQEIQKLRSQVDGGRKQSNNQCSSTFTSSNYPAQTRSTANPAVPKVQDKKTVDYHCTLRFSDTPETIRNDRPEFIKNITVRPATHDGNFHYIFNSDDVSSTSITNAREQHRRAQLSDNDQIRPDTKADNQLEHEGHSSDEVASYSVIGQVNCDSSGDERDGGDDANEGGGIKD